MIGTEWTGRRPRCGRVLDWGGGVSFHDEAACEVARLRRAIERGVIRVDPDILDECG